MVAQARVVLFSWVWLPKVIQPDSLPPAPAPSQWHIRTPRDRKEVAPQRVVTGLVGWRLIGANNRELGRGANPARSAEEACQSVHEAQLSLDRQVAGVSPHLGASWSWHLSLDDVRVAASSRGYQRQRECDYSLDHFRSQFPKAQVVRPPAHMFAAIRPPGEWGR
jgi:hypothetical protein